jgi:DNA-binding response OmpR family regulator
VTRPYEERQRLASEFPEVLVISGDLSLTQFLTEGLGQMGFWMSAVRSGLQALEVFRLRGFDAIVIDAAVADLRLDELVRRLRDPVDSAETVRTSIRTPVILVAGIEEELSGYEPELLNVEATLVAPFELDDLASELNRAIEALS